jgi:GNAT superfamily N-acetyltransferase
VQSGTTLPEVSEAWAAPGLVRSHGMRTDSGLDIAPLGAGDGAGAAAVQRLLDGELGEGMYGVRGLLADAADPTAGVWLAREPAAPGVAGAAVARLLVPADAVYYERFGPEATDLFRGTVGSLEAVAVEASFRRRGLGGRLASLSLGWMRQVGCDAAIALSWLSGRPDSSPPLFRRLGFREGPTVERFYAAESIANDWSCPVCGQPCRCGATLFTLRLT